VVRRERLGIGDVESGATQLATGESVGKGVVIHQAPARDVHEGGPRPHSLQRSLIDEAASGIVERRAENHVIGLGQQFVHRPVRDSVPGFGDDLPSRTAVEHPHIEAA
jgi:hypothetical protein